MKALEILKDNLVTAQQMEMSEKVINRYAYAIAELEALENRSCVSCKYSYDIFKTNIKFKGLGFCCDKLNVDKVFNEDFYCSEWELKC